MGKKVEKIYDEKQIIYEIYRMRGLTIQQLCEVVFHSKGYAYKFLQRMKEFGWLQDRMDMKGKIRQAKVYFCTDQAIEMLEREGFINKSVKAKDNTPPRNKMKYTVLTNEVYAALMPFGIYVYDSREWKIKNKMDRNTLVRGGLQMFDGREMGLYLFFSSEQISGAGLSDSMLTRFKHEVKKFPQTNRIAVLCYDLKIYEKMVKVVDKELSTFNELLVIPMGKNGLGFNLLRISRSQIERKAELETILNARLNESHPSLEGNKQNFAQYVADYGNHESYVVDFLSMNRPGLHHLATHYYRDAFEKDGRHVDLVCWKPNEKELIKKFQQYPHVNIISISSQEISDKYLPRLTTTKIKMKL